MTPLAPDSAESLAALLRGAIRSGQFGDGDRLPSIRQAARDFGIAQATAAKAYKTLEQEGIVVTRTAAGTRVSPGASRAPSEVVRQARAFADAAVMYEVSFDDAAALLRAAWGAALPVEDSADDDTV